MKHTWITLPLAALLLAGCGASAPAGGSAVSSQAASAAESTAQTQTASGDIFAMDTYMTITCYGEQAEAALAAAKAEIERLDALLSVGNAQSEISQINANGSGTVSEDTDQMLQKALELYKTTGGAFDITVYPLMQLWGFTSGDFAVPAESELQSLLQKAGADKLQYDPDTKTLTLGEGQGIDLGGIAKGYTSDRLMSIFADYGLSGAAISLGGNVQFYGAKQDGSLWRCGIEDPGDPESGNYLGVLEVGDKAVITSGAYERYFVDEETGKTYHHILDPATGTPAESGLTSVTVVSKSGMLADGLSTSCFVMGLEGAADYWRQYGSNFDLILMNDAGNVYVTEPLAESLQSNYPVYCITQEGIEQA